VRLLALALLILAGCSGLRSLGAEIGICCRAIDATTRDEIARRHAEDEARKTPEQRQAEERAREELAAQQWADYEARKQAVADSLAAIGDASAGQSQSMAADSSPKGVDVTRPPWQQTRAERPPCLSDVQCGVGNRCVKPNYSSRGTCMKVVNEYGTPVYAPPRTDSIMPKMPQPTDCNYGKLCPVGFTCDFKSGACIKR
jgi:hypothetical protein